AEAVRFLDAGEPPLVFTPGSADRADGKDFLAASAAACRLLGRRGLLLTRYPEQVPASLPPGVQVYSYLPFSQVLGRSAALVHYAGIGMVAQALAAGVPQLVSPIAIALPDNADRVARLGVGRVLPPRAYRPRRVARELEDLLGSAEVAAC